MRKGGVLGRGVGVRDVRGVSSWRGTCFLLWRLYQRRPGTLPFLLASQEMDQLDISSTRSSWNSSWALPNHLLVFVLAVPLDISFP